MVNVNHVGCTGWLRPCARKNTQRRYVTKFFASVYENCAAVLRLTQPVGVASFSSRGALLLLLLGVASSSQGMAQAQTVVHGTRLMHTVGFMVRGSYLMDGAL